MISIRDAQDVLRDAERSPDGWVVLFWQGGTALHIEAQQALKAGTFGLQRLCGGHRGVILPGCRARPALAGRW